MKKILLAVVLVLCLSVPAFAQPESSKTIKEAPSVVAMNEPKALISVGGINLPDINGDIGWSFRYKAMLAGGGIDLIHIKNNLFSIRGEGLGVVNSNEPSNPAEGAIAGTVNLAVAGQQIGGTVSSILNTINPSVGLYAGWDFNNSKVDGGVLVTIVKIPTDSIVTGIGKLFKKSSNTTM